MLKNLDERFKKGKQDKSFRRINSKHPIDIFVGYNDQGQATLTIKEKSNKENNLESTKYIVATIYKNENKTTYLTFNLLDDSMYSIFLRFCEDVITNSKNISKQNSIDFVIRRWSSWKKIFKNQRLSILSEKEIMGLIGELIFLKNNSIPKFGENIGIESWQGSSKTSKDFELINTWYEIKTKSRTTSTITISSIDQLDSHIIGYLVVNTLEKSNSTSNRSISLNKLIKEIENGINLFENKLKFRDKILECGYFENEEYDKYNFKLLSTDFYKISNDFPKVKKNSLDKGIVDVSYKIVIDSIKEYLDRGI